MKKLFYLLAAMFLLSGTYAQTLPYTDDFESYTVGGFIAAQNPDWWTTWSNAPGTAEDGEISAAQAHSPTKSLLIDKVPSDADVVWKLGNKTTGAYELKWWMFVDNAKAGYYNIQHFQSPGTEWAFEVYLNANGNGELYAGSTTAIAFTYPKATWFEVKHFIDLDADNIKLYINGAMIHEWPFSYQASSTTGTKQLGGVNFYAGAAAGETPQYFVDDVHYALMPTVLYTQGFDTYPNGAYVAQSDPEWFTTWSNAPGTPEDALISNAQSHSTANSALVDKTGGDTDLVMKLGNKTSGKYGLSWYMFVENNFAGYYNIQHFQSPGTEWAFEVYLNANGSGELYAGSTTPIAFNYPKATWFEVNHDIDLDNDLIKLYINGNLIHQWPFSYQASSTTGTKQLGGVNFYAGAAAGETPKYFFDDVLFTMEGVAAEPQIEVSPTSLTAYIEPGQTSTQQVTITNNGTADLTFDAIVILNSDKLGSVNPGSQPGVSMTNASVGPVLNAGAPATDAVAVLNYDGDNQSAIGWNTVPVTVTVAAMFPNSMTLPYAGMMIKSVDIVINQINSTGSNQMTLKIYGMGTTYEPGALLYQQNFTPFGGGWENIVLTSPVLINGQDIWVGYTFTQNETGIYIPGTDGGPNHPYGDFLSTGVGWSHLANNPNLPYNWNIRANLEGTPFTQWLSVSPTSGTVPAAGTLDLDVTFNATNQPVGVYEGIVRILSNDNDNPVVDVTCVLDCSVGINEMDKVAVVVYPNPAKDRINILSNRQVLEVRLVNFAGKVVYSGIEKSIDISRLSAGVYFVQTVTSSGVSSIKFVKE